ncbi:MAG: family 78 glycoside hydrolase catalytic domain [Prevotellaceae bacterium]|nr:family 78 glycoside hydrolase catalytic domain [Prevotellaceae bacterium]
MKPLLSLLALWVVLQSATAQTVCDLRCEDLPNPLGVEQTAPRLSWKVATDKPNYWQKAYQIQVRTDGKLIWDSRKVWSDRSVSIPYGGTALQPATHYQWRVRCWGTVGRQTAWSAWKDFSTGLFDESDWRQAQWIAMQPDHHAQEAQAVTTDYRLPLLRKAFFLPKPVQRATAYVCGLGHFDLFLNGKKVGNHFLDAGWTKYDVEALYVTFDVTHHLQQGSNAIGIMLGNGFHYIPRERYFKLLTDYGAPKMRLLMHIEYEDGTIDDVVSDTTWRVAPSPIVYSSIFGGEDYDATLLPSSNWTQPTFDDVQWTHAISTQYVGTLHSQTSIPVIVRQEMPIKQKFKNAAGHWVYDLGQNFSGIISIELAGERGRHVIFRPAELLNADSTVNQSAIGQPYYFSYRTNGNAPEHWQPQFSYYGFRYVQVEGAVPADEDNPNNLPVLTALKGLHISNAADEAGTFSCSNPLFNQIHTLIDWAIRSNAQSILTDCPHREKLGWIEQAHLMQSSILYRYDYRTFYAKILHDMETSQRPDGCIPSITPEYTRFADGFEDSPEWGSAFIIVPWQYYQTYGDDQLIRRHYPAMKRYLDYLTSRAADGILAYGLGDWYDIGPNPPGYAQLTSTALTATAIYYHDIATMQQMAELLGERDDAQHYAHMAEAVRAAFRQAFLNSQTHEIERNSQTAIAMTIALGLLDADEIEYALCHLVHDIRQRGNALTTGDIGFHYLLTALADNGRSDIIYDMNIRTDTPGYGYQLKHGATALTESWQALPNASNNHLMLGHILEWLYASVGGIRQQAGTVGYRHILIAPQVVGDLTSASTTYQSPYGKIACTWQLDTLQRIFRLDATLPPNTNGQLLLPCADGSTTTKNVGSGHHSFEVEW